MVSDAQVADQPDHAPSPGAHVSSQELASVLSAALDALSDDQREVVLYQRRQMLLSQELAIAALRSERDERLVRADKLATMGALATGIAHEVSTPLGVILGPAEQLISRANARITDPFFTTKPIGEGSGLSLAIANELIKHHRGTLTVASRPSHRGTGACVELPTPDGPSRG